MSNLPKQVLAQAEEVAELDKMFDQPDEVETGLVEANQEPAEAPGVVQPKADEETWQKRYQTLQGMFNAEVPRLNAQVKELQTQLKETLEGLESIKKSEPQPEAPPKRLVTEEDVEAYGGDLLDLVKRQASEVFQQERAQLQKDLAVVQAENAELRKQLGGVAEKVGETDRRAYFLELEKEVPDYKAVNVDPAFMEWLAVVDPLSGLPRQTYLNAAYQQFDVARTAALFNAWKNETGKAAPAVKQVEQELKRQVAPGTSRASAPQSSNAGEKIWSMQDIEKFYVEASKGRYSRDEVARIEAEIDAAVAAGRLRQ